MNIQEINILSDKIRMQRDIPNMATLLQLIKQHDYKFDKDEVLEIASRILGREFIHFITPNKIAKLISVIAGIYNKKSVIDICCGSGNILSYFKDLQDVKGVDINANIITLAQYINPAISFTVQNFLEYHQLDIFKKDNYDDLYHAEKYDLVIGHLPFDNRFSNCQEYRELFSEGRPNCNILDIDLIKAGLSFLNKDGVAIFTVPENLFLASSNWENEILSKFREELLSNYSLDMIINLPSGAFFPYSGIKKSILVIKNGSKNQDVFMSEFKDNSLEIADNFKNHKGDFYLPISNITDRLDKNYYELKQKMENLFKGHDLKKLSDVASILNGKPVKDERKPDGKYLVFNQKDKSNNEIFVDKIDDEKLVLRDNDIVIGLVGENPKIHFHKVNDNSTVIKNDYAIIRPSNKILSAYLNTEEGKFILENQIRLQIKPNITGNYIPRLSASSLKNFLIPVLTYQEIIERFLNEKQNLINQVNILINKKEYDSAKLYVKNYFDNSFESSEHKFVYLKYIDNAEELDKKNKELEEKNQQLQAKEKELEDMMSMFAHKFRSPLDAIIYNTTHDKDTKLYTESANTMRGLLDIFSIISADDKVLTDKLKNDNKGNTNLMTIFNKNLNMTLLHLLSVSGMSKIHQHYMNYAKAQGKITDAVSYKEWCDDYFEMEGVLQKQWEKEFSALLNQSASLAERLQWLEQYFFKLEIIGFEIEYIQFKEYETTESFLFILMNEILVNAFKYYASENKQSVVLEWTATENDQILSCRNPSIRRERDQHKGSGKGHTFLSALARKTGCKFTKPKPQDDFLLEFAIPNQLLLSNSGTEK
ncbi:MAG: hypothetical protein RIQ94_1326 [Pseudomonadota bacterium]|jgi:SAM-dependent methyltransferase